MLLLEGADLAEADAVLAGAGAAARERVVDDVVDELLRPRQLGGVVGDLDGDVDVAVAGMPDDARMQPQPVDLGAGEATAAASSVTGTQTSVARSFVPGICAAVAWAASWRALHRRARASGSRSCTISSAPSASAIACTSSRSATTIASLPGRLDDQARPFRVRRAE